MAHTVTIRHGLFWYSVEVSNPTTKDPDNKAWIERTSFFGETVEIPRDADYERGVEIGAFEGTMSRDEMADAGMVDRSTPAGPEPDVQLSELNDDQLTVWVEAHSIADVLAAVGDDNPALADRVLGIEEVGKARKGLTDKLTELSGLGE